MSPELFQLFMLPIKNPLPQWQHQYKLAMKTWLNVWNKVNENFALPGPLYTDGYCRQDEAATLFYGEECAGMLLFRTMDFSALNYRLDSYFKDWTDSDIEHLLSHGPKVFAAVYLSVAPEYRNFHPELKFKQVLMNIMIRRFLNSDAHVIANVSRIDRGINDEGHKLGAYSIRANVPFFGGKDHVDLVAYPRNKAKEYSEPLIRQFTDSLWSRRMDWQTEQIGQKKAG